VHQSNKRVKAEDTNFLPADYDSLGKKYFDAFTHYQEQTSHFNVSEDAQVEFEEGQSLSFEKWLQREKKKLHFYVDNYPERYNVLSNWFTNEVLNPIDEISNEKEMGMSAPKSPEKDNNFADDSQTMSTVNSSLLSMTADTVITTSSSILSQSILQSCGASEKTATSTIGNSVHLIAFEYEKGFLHYIGLGRVIKSVVKDNMIMVILQKFIVCEPENLRESLVEETNETATIHESKIFKSNCKFIQFFLTVNSRSKFISFFLYNNLSFPSFYFTLYQVNRD
jgi:hypothetical protein